MNTPDTPLTINDVLVAAAGYRYSMETSPEPLRVSVSRRIRLTLSRLLGISPFVVENGEWTPEKWSPFRQTRITYRRFAPGEPGYSNAESLGDKIHYKYLHSNPWIDLIRNNRFPSGMGETIHTLKQ